MRNLFKKSLAICLAIALCLTAMVGLTVSAEDVTIAGTITANGAEVEAGATSATVSFTLAATDLSEVILSLEASEGAEITAATAPEGTTAYAVIPKAEDDFSLIAFSTYEVGVVTSEATVNVTVTFAEAADYTVTATLGYGMGATNKEELIVVADPAVANITVKAAAHVHTPAEAVVENEVPATCYSKGSYDSVVYCTAEGCDLENKEISRKTITVDETDHTPAVAVVENNVDPTCTVAGSYESVVYCSVEDCKKEISRKTVTVDALGHTEGEFKSATPATSTVPGKICFDCTACDVDIVEDVTYRAYSILDTPKIGCTSKTEFIFNTPSIAVEGSTEGIFTYTQTYVSGNTNVVALPVSDEYKVSYGYAWPVAVPYSGFTEEYDTALYLKVDGVWTNGGNSVRSVKALAMNNMIKASGIDEQIKKIAANLLYAGARTQEAFNYGKDNLADADLIGDYAAYVTTSEPTLVKTPGENYTNFPADYKGKALFDTPSIVLGDSVAIRHTVRLDFYSGAKDDIKLKYEYTSFDGTLNSEYLVVEPEDENTYVFDLGVNAPDMRSAIKFTIYNGNTAIGDVSPYSIEAVMKHTYDSGNYIDIINAVMNYSDATLDYFS